MVQNVFDGEKYPGGLGSQLDFFYIDYWKLRRRSYRLFTENRYAKGLINRLLTNEIHWGLLLEATPDSNILPQDNEFLNDCADEVESKFSIWSENKELVSWDAQRTFGQIQRDIRKTALLSGDVLIILRQHPDTKTPVIQLIDGYNVRSPLDDKGKVPGATIKEGVEVDAQGRHIAFWVRDGSDPLNITSKRIAARGPKTRRRVAWMVYGHKIRVSDTRGMPALGVLIQSLKELDRYSDAEQRAAVLNSILAVFIKRGKDKIRSTGYTGGAQLYESAGQSKSDGSSVTREFNIAKQLPGVVLDQLQVGEEPESFSAARPNVNYRAFEEAMMASFAWALEIPPNIYRLAFSSNYSASGAEINELKIYLDRMRKSFASDAIKMFYKEWLLSMVLIDKIAAPGLLESWRNPRKFLESGAWFSSDWAGAVKPSLRLIQDVKAFTAAIAESLMTRDMATKFLWGRKFTTISRKLSKENEEMVAAVHPLITAGLLIVQEKTTEKPEE